MSISDMFWRTSPEEHKKGFFEEEGDYICLFCGEIFEKGTVYPDQGISYEAKDYVRLHIEKIHGSVFVVLQGVADNFQSGRTYSEKEVNQILKSINDDYVTVRRYLIECGFLDRKPDGSQYWLK